MGLPTYLHTHGNQYCVFFDNAEDNHGDKSTILASTTLSRILVIVRLDDDDDGDDDDDDHDYDDDDHDYDDDGDADDSFNGNNRKEGYKDLYLK